MLSFWRRRYWRRNQAALDKFEGQRPATVITGATSGIGYELAQLFARERKTLVLIARSESDLQSAQQKLSQDNSNTDTSSTTEIVTISVDITDQAAASAIRTQLSDRNIYVDELINNAGLGLSGPFSNEDPIALDQLNNLNIAALTTLSREFLPDMVVRGQGGIINIASLGGLTPGPFQAAYYASKAYVVSLTQALKYENRGQGVRFTVVAPGPVNTDFHAQMDAERAFYRRFLPAMTARAVAQSTLFWYKLGHTVVVPGAFNRVLAICLWLVPSFLTIPVVAFLLNPRDAKRDTRRKGS